MTVDADRRIDILRGYGKGLRWFVETGTADGYTTLALVGDFERLITIELDYDRYLSVTSMKLMHHPNVLPLFGDSPKVLREVTHWLPGPSLFWLDAHYSGGARGPGGDTPILQELEVVGGYICPAGNPNLVPVKHIILIDDARLFGTDPAYPDLPWMHQWAARRRYRCTVADDIIRLTPL